MNSVSLFYLRGSSSVQVPFLLKTATYSSDNYSSSSKRRSRGPVMAKKASEGLYCAVLYNYKILIGQFKHVYLWLFLVLQT